MTPMEVNHDLFAKLIITLEQAEITSCLRKSRPALILAKEKAQNLPRNSKALSEFARKLKPQSQEILLTWIEKNITPEEEDYSGLLQELVELVELGKLQKLSKDTLNTRRLICRRLLIGISHHKVPQEFLNELNNLFNGSNTRINNKETLSDNNTIEMVKDNLVDHAKLLCEIALDEDITSHQNTNDSSFKFIQGLTCIRKNDLPSLDHILTELDKQDVYYTHLSECRTKLVTKIKDGELPPRGLIFETEIKYTPEEIDIEEMPWLCRCYKISGTQAFFIPLGYLKANRIIIVPKNDLEDLLPSEGRVIAHSDKIGKLPQENEVAFWNVEPYPTEKSIKVKAKSRVTTRDVYEVIEVPFQSNDVDNIRHWLISEGAGLVNKTIFLLEDNILIKPRIIPINTKNINFNEPFSLWHSLPAYKIAEKSYVIGPLPKQDDSYNCEEIDSSLRKIIKQSVEQGNFPKLSNAQIKDFIITLHQTSSFDVLQLDRIEKYLSDTSAKINKVDTIVADLLELKIIQDDIELKKEKILEEFQKGHEEHKKEITALIEEKKSIEHLIKDKKDEINTLSNSLTTAIESTFIKAKSDGMATLAENALLQAILFNNSMPSTKANTLDQISLTISPKTELLPQDLLRSLGLDKRDSRILCQLMINASKQGFIVLIKGFSSDYFSHVLASVLEVNKINVIEIPFGISDSAVIQESINTGLTNNDCLIIKSINRSPLNLIGSKLEHLVINNWLSKESKSLNCIATICDDDSCFTMPDKYKFLGPIVDIYAPLSQHPINDILEKLEDLKSKRIIGGYAPKIWINKIISLTESLTQQDPDDYSIVLKYIQNFFIPNSVLKEIQGH